MTTAVVDYCRRTGQAAPETPAAFARAIFESLALTYRLVLERLEQVTGQTIGTIRVIGGGAQNDLLNQLTADATGRLVVAGPVEATALGNIAIQMLATGHVATLGEARDIIDRSFPTGRFHPTDTDRWERHYRRFRDVLELSCV
jgi:sugar (pentulose or hexulose) kinase